MLNLKKPKLKLDFEQYTQPKDPEPKTLLECYEEAGCFPFVAKALFDNPNHDSPHSRAGSEFRAIRMTSCGGIVSDKHPYGFLDKGEYAIADAVNPVLKRWTLLAKI